MTLKLVQCSCKIHSLDSSLVVWRLKRTLGEKTDSRIPVGPDGNIHVGADFAYPGSDRTDHVKR